MQVTQPAALEWAQRGEIVEYLLSLESSEPLQQLGLVEDIDLTCLKAIADDTEKLITEYQLQKRNLCLANGRTDDLSMVCCLMDLLQSGVSKIMGFLQTDSKATATLDVQIALAVLLLKLTASPHRPSMSQQHSDRLLRLFAQSIQIGYEAMTRKVYTSSEIMGKQIDALGILLLSTVLRQDLRHHMKDKLMEGFVQGMLSGTKSLSDTIRRCCRRYVEEVLKIHMACTDRELFGNYDHVSQMNFLSILYREMKSRGVKHHAAAATMVNKALQSIEKESKSVHLLFSIICAILKHSTPDLASLGPLCDLLSTFSEGLFATAALAEATQSELALKKDKLPPLPPQYKEAFTSSLMKFFDSLKSVPYAALADRVVECLGWCVRLTAWAGCQNRELAASLANTVVHCFETGSSGQDEREDVEKEARIVRKVKVLLDHMAAIRFGESLITILQVGLTPNDALTRTKCGRLEVAALTLNLVGNEIWNCLFGEANIDELRLSYIQDLLPPLLQLRSEMFSDWKFRFQCLQNVRSKIIGDPKSLESIRTLLGVAMEASEGKVAKVMELSEEISLPEQKAANLFMASLYSCFGTELIYQAFPDIFRLNLDAETDARFIMTSGLWTLESLREARGRVESASFIHIFVPIIQNCQQITSAAQKEREENALKKVKTPLNVKALVCAAVKTQIWNTLPAFLTQTADIAPTMISQEGQHFLDSLCQAEVTLDELIILVKAFCAYLRTLVDLAHALKSPDFDQYRISVWQKLFFWAMEKARQPGLLVEACKLMEVCAATIDPSLISTIVKQLSTYWTEETIRNQSIQKFPPDVSMELTCTSLTNGFKYTPVCSDMGIYLQRALTLLRMEPSLSIMRSLFHLIVRILELYVSCEFGTLEDIKGVLLYLRETQQSTPVTLWKTRLQVHLAVLRYLEHIVARKQLSTDPAIRADVVSFLLINILFEACFKCSSMTGVTRRRAYRLLDRSCLLVIQIRRDETGSDVPGCADLARVLMAGLCGVESIQLQRGFVKAIEKILEIGQVPLDLTLREQLSTLVSLCGSACFNLDKKSTKSSRAGSWASKSTRFTKNSSVSVKSRSMKSKTSAKLRSR